MPNHRYAIYYTPAPEHPLWQAGCTWLQRDPAHDGDITPPTRPHVREPWRYGFHATLKPPMHLAEGRDEGGLIRAASALAAETPRFEMPALTVQWLGDFLALRPRDALPREHALHRLADACVTRLEPWRAGLSPQALQKRLAAPLSGAQHELLQRYGYPHVLGEWRFHMTLSDPLPDDDALRTPLAQAASAHFAHALGQPLGCDALSVFVEPAPGQPLRRLRLCPLA